MHARSILASLIPPRRFAYRFALRKTVLIAAHGNSIRGILKALDDISDEDITGLEIPTGIPLVYHLDKDLKPIKSPRASGFLSGYFLADPKALAAAQKKVADQTQVADG
eukprot:3824014-Pleurochrysis_carterae.AAC.1